MTIMDKTTPSTDPVEAQFYLSRSSYPLGSSILGTVHISPNFTTDGSTTSSTTKKSTTPSSGGQESGTNDPSSPSNETHELPSPGKKKIQSIQLYIAGRCRIDPRWHHVPTITSVYGTHPCHDDLPSHYDVEHAVVDSYFGYAVTPPTTLINSNSSSHVSSSSTVTASEYNSTNAATTITSSSSSSSTKKNMTVPCVCFWSTNVLQLYHSNPDKVSEVTQLTTTKKNSSLTTHLDENGWYQKTNRFLQQHREGMGTQHNDADVGDWKEVNDLEYNDSDEDEMHPILPKERNTVDSNDVNDPTDPERTIRADKDDNSNVGLLVDKKDGKDCVICDINGNSNTTGSPPPHAPTEQNQSMNFTFRVDLPDDLPPSANTTCARYFYSAVLVVQTTDGQCIILQSPFTVTSPRNKTLAANMKNNQNHSSISSTNKTRIRIGTIHAFAHPPNTPQPIHLPSTIAQDPKWDISVQRMDCSWDVSNVRTLPLQHSGHSFGTLTIVGGSVMVPGGKVLLHFEFDNDDVDNLNNDDDDDYDNVTVQSTYSVTCHQICACLQGEEHAILSNRNAGNTKESQQSKRRTRYNVFDTVREIVHPGYTRSLSASLALPMDCPITLETDLVEVCISCRLDITIQVPDCIMNGGGGNRNNTLQGIDDADIIENDDDDSKFQVLTVEFPCRVVHSTVKEDDPQQVDDSDEKLSKDLEDYIVSLAKRGSTMEKDIPNSSYKVLTADVLDDLQMLSFHSMNKVH